MIGSPSQEVAISNSLGREPQAFISDPLTMTLIAPYTSGLICALACCSGCAQRDAGTVTDDQAVPRYESAPEVASARLVPVFSRDVAPLLDQYCLRCHDAASARGGVALDVFRDGPPDQNPQVNRWLLWRSPTLDRLRRLARRAELLKSSAPWIAMVGPPLLFALSLDRSEREAI